MYYLATEIVHFTEERFCEVTILPFSDFWRVFLCVVIVMFSVWNMHWLNIATFMQKLEFLRTVNWFVLFSFCIKQRSFYVAFDYLIIVRFYFVSLQKSHNLQRETKSPYICQRVSIRNLSPAQKFQVLLALYKPP